MTDRPTRRAACVAVAVVAVALALAGPAAADAGRSAPAPTPAATPPSPDCAGPSPTPYEDGAVYTADSGFRAYENASVLFGTFPDGESIRFGDVVLRSPGSDRIGVENATGATTCYARVEANRTTAGVTVAPDGATNVTVRGVVEVLSLGDVVADRTTDRDLAYRASSGWTLTTTLSPAGADVEAVDLSTGDRLARDTVAGDGTANFSLPAGEYPVAIQRLDPPNLTVAIDRTTAPVVETNTLEVTATVTNRGEKPGSQTVSLAVAGAERDSQSVSLGPGENRTITLSWDTVEGDAGDYTATVATANDSATTPVTVQEPGSLAVSIDRTNAPVVEGETLGVEATVTNAGDREETGSVALTVAGRQRDSETVTLAPGASTTISLEWPTVEDEVGNYTASVVASNDSDSTPVSVIRSASLSVSIDGTTAPVGEGETLAVTATVRNGGESGTTETVALAVGGERRDATELSVSAGESRTVTLVWNTTTGDAGDYAATVTAGAGSESVEVSVLPPTDLSVTIDGTTAPVTAGDPLTVEATVSNDGTDTAEETVALTIGGERRDAVDVSVGPGESRTVSLTWDTATGDAGDYVAVVSAGAGSASTDVTVESAGDGDDGDGDGDGDGDDGGDEGTPVLDLTLADRVLPEDGETTAVVEVTGGRSVDNYRVTVAAGDEVVVEDVDVVSEAGYTAVDGDADNESVSVAAVAVSTADSGVLLELTLRGVDPGRENVSLSVASVYADGEAYDADGDVERVFVGDAPGLDVDEDGNLSADPDGDGIHEDIDGDGDVSTGDVQALLNDLVTDVDAARRPALYDADGDDEVGTGDVQALLDELVSTTASGRSTPSPSGAARPAPFAGASVTAPFGVVGPAPDRRSIARPSDAVRSTDAGRRASPVRPVD